MALSSSRKLDVGETPHAHEREAIDFAFSVIPDTDPYQAWALVELLEPNTGRLYEIDLLVLGYSALYLVEIKSGPGRYEGDHQEWWRTPPDEKRPRYMDGPLSLANLKAKVLKTRIQSKMRNPSACPYVQPLIFLSAADLDLKLKPEGRIGVVTRSDLAEALKFHRFTGANPCWRAERIDRPVMRDVAEALRAIGIRPRKGRAYVGSFELSDILADGPGYQDRIAIHKERKFRTRARVYLVPQQASVERRQQLLRAADRDYTLLWDVREHPNVLRTTDFVLDAPLGPTVLFDDFAGGVPLDVFMRRETLAFHDRLEIIVQVGRALAHCHRKSIIHGAIAPQSVLVRRHPDTQAIDTRLFNFQLGGGGTLNVEATQHWSALAHEGWAVYQAPELRDDPLARSPQSDLFSLGALAFFVLTGRAPGERVEDVDRLLETRRYLDPRAVQDGIRPQVAECFEYAANIAPVYRLDDVDEWIEFLLTEATAPELAPTKEEIDPLEATRDAVLADRFVVESVLGVGATARVLRVRRLSDERRLALKVSSDPSHDPRLGDELAVLEKLPKHPRIVEVFDTPPIKGRKCMLVSLAGEQTLQQKLAAYGPVSIEEASRYGDDLLYALEHLEENQVLHRDIKPANLGVGPLNKTADHLTLFDFSLARLPTSEIQVGTAVYRDPYLRTEGRGVWDFAADRWGAAITLHEMLAGTRPAFPSGSALDPDAKMELSAERFDASVRAGLIEFFERAFARSAADRFKSAQEMRHAWVSVVGAPARSAKARTAATTPRVEPDESLELTDADIARIGEDAPIDVLPLSIRARNALDRAGLMRAHDLMSLADSRVSQIRGVGRLVYREILEFRNRWIALRAAPAGLEAPSFFPGYAGDDLDVSTMALPPGVADALIDGGLPRLRSLAHAPAPHVEGLAKRGAFSADELRRVLATESDRANQREHPTTLAGWTEAMLPKKRGRKDGLLVRALYGLEPPFEGRVDLTVRELAAAKQVTAPAVYIALGKAREDWATHASLADLRAMLFGVLDAFDGAASLAAAAGEVVRMLPPSGDAESDTARAQAAALFRVLAEVDKEWAGGVRLLRTNDRELWAFESEATAQATRALGKAADELAARPALAAMGEARRVLGDAVEATPLAALKDERLFDLAARASAHAACSARFELYPRGLDGRRALELCAATLKSGTQPGVSEADVRERVAARYPEAAPLPARPLLDAYLEPLGFRWDEGSARYLRLGEGHPTTLATAHTSFARAPTGLPTQPRAMDEGAIGARQFGEKLKHAIEMNAFRVLGVASNHAQDAAVQLAARLDAELVAFDVELAKEVALQIRKANIKDDDVIHSADRAGPTGEHWSKLVTLVQLAAKALAARLLPNTRPLVLVQPGPIQRYGLADFLRRLVEVGADRETPAIFLLVPNHDTGGLPRINGTMPIAGIVPGQTLWVSKTWLENRDNAAA